MSTGYSRRALRAWALVCCIFVAGIVLGSALIAFIWHPRAPAPFADATRVKYRPLYDAETQQCSNTEIRAWEDAQVEMYECTTTCAVECYVESTAGNHEVIETAPGIYYYTFACFYLKSESNKTEHSQYQMLNPTEFIHNGFVANVQTLPLEVRTRVEQAHRKWAGQGLTCNDHHLELDDNMQCIMTANTLNVYEYIAIGILLCGFVFFAASRIDWTHVRTVASKLKYTWCKQRTFNTMSADKSDA